MPKQVYHKAERLELREEMCTILFNELLLDQSDEERAEFAGLMEKAVKAHPAMSKELSALEDACTGYGVQMAEEAFMAGPGSGQRSKAHLVQAGRRTELR